MEGAVDVRRIGDLEGEVRRSGSGGGGGEDGSVDETAVSYVDEEVEVGEEVSTDDRDGDVGHYEVPLVGADSKGEPHGFVAVRQDARAVGSHKVSIGASTTSAVYLGLWKEGPAGAASIRKQRPVRTSSKKNALEATAKGADLKACFFDHSHGCRHFLAIGPKWVW